MSSNNLNGFVVALIAGIMVFANTLAAEDLILPHPQKISQQSMKEPYSKFVCAADNVLIGRHHVGDENGNTTYKSAPLVVFGKPTLKVETKDHKWHNWIKESSGTYFVAPAGRIITGREHRDDENGHTRYRTSVVVVGGKQAKTKNVEEVFVAKESNGTWAEKSFKVMIGRKHWKDENGPTWYKFANLYVD